MKGVACSMIEMFVSENEIASLKIVPIPYDLRELPDWETRVSTAGIDPAHYNKVMTEMARDEAIMHYLQSKGLPIGLDGWKLEWRSIPDEPQTGPGRLYLLSEMTSYWGVAH